MTFGPESTNPRERRAYTHAVLSKARQSGTLQDLEVAEHAVMNAGNSRKTVKSNFSKALAGVALLDKSTSTIYEKATTVIDPESTPRTPVTEYEDTVTCYPARYSEDFSLAYAEGSVLIRVETREKSTGKLKLFGELSAVDHAGDKIPYSIPTDKLGNPDALAIRRLPDAIREHIAKIVEPVSIIEPKPYVTRQKLY